MRIDWTTTCRFAETHDGLATIIGAGIDTIWVPQLPAATAATVIVRIVGLPREIRQPHIVEARILDPQMNEVTAPLSATMRAEAVAAADPRWEQGAFLPILFRWETRTAGVHTFDLAVDGQRRTLAMNVVEGTPPSPLPTRR